MLEGDAPRPPLGARRQDHLSEMQRTHLGAELLRAREVGDVDGVLGVHRAADVTAAQVLTALLRDAAERVLAGVAECTRFVASGGLCVKRCASAARQAPVDITYLAEKFDAEVRPPAARRRRMWRVAFAISASDNGSGRGASRRALGSSRLLLHHAPALGTRFFGNGDALGLALDPSRPDVQAHVTTSAQS